METAVRLAVEKYVLGIDGDTVEYLLDIIIQNGVDDKRMLAEVVIPFIEGYAADTEDAERIYDELFAHLQETGLSGAATESVTEPTILGHALESIDISAEEQQAIDKMWGFDKIRNKRNETIEISDALSAKLARRVEKEQTKWLADLEAQFTGEEEDTTKVCDMVLPELSNGFKLPGASQDHANDGSNRRDVDIQVNNVNLQFAGRLLLEDAELRIVYGRRYGLVGRNGIGKTTLLKHIANFSIEGFPKHHRVLHVKQEVAASNDSVFNVVMGSDVERNMLLKREEELLAIQENLANGDSIDNMAGLAHNPEDIERELQDVYTRMEITGVKTAESRVSAILTGLQFTPEMQSHSTASLSGGWRMRVSLAVALFITPQLLMLGKLHV